VPSALGVVGVFRDEKCARALSSAGAPVAIPLGECARLRIARNGNRHYREMMKRLLRPHRAAIRSDNIPEETLEALIIDATAHTILLGWEGIEDEGKEMPYSVENAKVMLSKYSLYLC
jgi:hypothetical protein